MEGVLWSNPTRFLHIRGHSAIQSVTMDCRASTAQLNTHTAGAAQSVCDYPSLGESLRPIGTVAWCDSLNWKQHNMKKTKKTAVKMDYKLQLDNLIHCFLEEKPTKWVKYIPRKENK